MPERPTLSLLSAGALLVALTLLALLPGATWTAASPVKSAPACLPAALGGPAGQNPGGPCTPTRVISCGGQDRFHNDGVSTKSSIDYYPCAGSECSQWGEYGPEVTYTFVPNISGSVYIDLFVEPKIPGVPSSAPDLDVFVLSTGLSGPASCDGSNCMVCGNDGAVGPILAGETYYIVVDGYGSEATVGDYVLTVACVVAGAATPTPRPTSTPVPQQYKLRTYLPLIITRSGP